MISCQNTNLLITCCIYCYLNPYIPNFLVHVLTYYTINISLHHPLFLVCDTQIISFILALLSFLDTFSMQSSEVFLMCILRVAILLNVVNPLFLKSQRYQLKQGKGIKHWLEWLNKTMVPQLECQGCCFWANTTALDKSKK